MVGQSASRTVSQPPIQHIGHLFSQLVVGQSFRRLVDSQFGLSVTTMNHTVYQPVKIVNQLVRELVS